MGCKLEHVLNKELQLARVGPLHSGLEQVVLGSHLIDRLAMRGRPAAQLAEFGAREADLVRIRVVKHVDKSATTPHFAPFPAW